MSTYGPQTFALHDATLNAVAEKTKKKRSRLTGLLL
jgi:hypothetical protein